MGPTTDLLTGIEKALVTGGNGFVGKAICTQLLRRNIKVVVLGRNHYPDLLKMGVRTFKGDIADAEVMTKASKGVDLVFHVAALAGIWGNWQNYYKTNVVGTKNVAAAALKAGVKGLVYTSTPSVVFDGDDIEGGDESLPYARKPLCHYARSKIEAERIVLAMAAEDFAVCALRPHLIWGPNDPHLLPRLLERGRKNQLKRVGSGDNLVDISYIDDVAKAHILAAENLVTTATANGKAFFISQGTPVNLWDWVADFFSRMDIAPVTKSVPFPLSYAMGGLLEAGAKIIRRGEDPPMTRFLAEQLAKSHYFKIDQARKLLNYAPETSIEEGLERTVEWLRRK